MPITLPAPQLGTQMDTGKFGARVQQGSQIYLMIGGQPIGYMTQISQNDSEGTEAFYGIGTIMPIELQPLRWTGTLSVSGARLYDASWQSAFMTPGSNVLTQGLANIVVYNRVTQQPDVIFVGCVPTTYGSTWAANAFSLQNGSWLYLDVKTYGYGAFGNSQITQAAAIANAANAIP